MNWELIRGIESLSRGCPFYKHSKCDEVPWPRVNPNPKYTGTEEVWKSILGEEQYKIEVDRLNNLTVPDTRDVISHHINIPSRVTYTTRLPFFKLHGDSEFILCDPSNWTGTGTPAPGSCLVTGIRIRAPKDWSFENIQIYLSGNLVQTLTWELFKFINIYLGMNLLEENEDECLMTLPLFFSRDPVYSIPLFVVDEIRFHVTCSSALTDIYADLTILHTKEEIKQIKLKHVLRTDHHAERRTEGSPMWLYMPSFWRDLGEGVGQMRIDYDGSKDEEIKGVFWELQTNERVSVSISYRFSGGELKFIDNIPQDLVSKSEFGRMLGSMVRGSRSYTGRNYGGYLFSSYFDDGDCSPGLTPRNGELYIEFSKPIFFRVYVYSSRDWINQKNGCK